MVRICGLVRVKRLFFPGRQAPVLRRAHPAGDVFPEHLRHTAVPVTRRPVTQERHELRVQGDSYVVWFHLVAPFCLVDGRLCVMDDAVFEMRLTFHAVAEQAVIVIVEWVFDYGFAGFQQARGRSVEI